MGRKTAALLGGIALAVAVFLCGAGAPSSAAPDFGREDTLLRYIEAGEHMATAYEQAVTDGYSRQYRCREIAMTSAFADYSGAKKLLELELAGPATVGFQIAAGVTGNYQVVVLPEDADILLTASSFQWQAASRPLDAPAGRVGIFLVGDGATGELRVDLQPPATATLIVPENPKESAR